MHVVSAVCAAALPLLMLLNVLSDDDESITAWKLYERVDIIVLIFSVLAVLLAGASFVVQRRSFMVAAAALLFASFGLLLPVPLESNAQSDDTVAIGAWLSVIVSLVGAGAAAYAAELVPSGAGAPAAGAGRAADPSFTTPIGGGAPAPTGPPQAPAGGGGIAPGWYNDPHGQARLRYFDGQNWTEQTSN